MYEYEEAITDDVETNIIPTKAAHDNNVQKKKRRRPSYEKPSKYNRKKLDSPEKSPTYWNGGGKAM